MLKITPDRQDDDHLKVRLCGQLTKEYIPELERTLNTGSTESRNVALDLSNVTFVDREAMEFLCSAKSRNITIENCPSYVIRWIQQEGLCRNSANNPQETKPSE